VSLHASLLVAGLLAGFLLCELALRVLDVRPERHRPRYRVSNRGDLAIRAGATVLDCYGSNPRGYFDLDLGDPAVRSRYEAIGMEGLAEVARGFPWAVEFAYNGSGYRERAARPRVAEVRRVAIVGDSFTEGQGVKVDETLARLLERGLSRPGRPVEVLNFGHRGYDFPDLMKPFADALAAEPDVVVYAMVLNDADQSQAFKARWPRLNDWIMVRRPEVPLGPLQSRVAALVKDTLETRAIARETTAWYREMYGEPNRRGWERTRQQMAQMRAEAEARGARFQVVLWPLVVGLEGAYPFDDVHAAIGRACQRLGLPLVDLLPVLRGRRSADLQVHPADLHPNEVANRLAAEAVQPVLDPLLP
jgi:lysophospholipase L1-like esterase